MSIKDLRKRVVVVIYDALTCSVAWLIALYLALNFNIPNTEVLHQQLMMCILVMVFQIVSNALCGLYRMLWKFASIPDLACLVKSTLATTLLISMGVYVFENHFSLPKSVPIIYLMLSISCSAGGRVLYRWLRDYHKWFHHGKPTLIIGAEQAGIYLAKELLRDSSKSYKPVGFIDDGAHTKRVKIHGLPVLGRSGKLKAIIRKYHIELVFISSPKITAESMRDIIDICNEADIEFRALPNLRDIIEGRVTIDAYRPVEIEDLLGREPIALNWDNIQTQVNNATVLVTGGGGSIGSELCRQIAKLAPSKLIIVDNSEYNLFVLENELRKLWANLPCEFILVDVCDTPALTKLFESTQIDLVFHAAAYKHVPMLEHQVRTAMQNNVIGTKTVADLAAKNDVKSFVLISTDKAVNPTNIMGATKRVAEIYCQNLNERVTTNFITVRFGNVLGSRGSVIPIFEEQLKAGGPLTVTHPDITRFFMTIPEAVELILQAMTMGEGGEIFVLEMGEPVKINYLAEQFIRLSGREPYKDIEIVYTGLRQGEKLYEELFHEGEKVEATSHEKILRSQSRKIEAEVIGSQINKVIQGLATMDEVVLRDALVSLVPENRFDKAGKGRVTKVANLSLVGTES